MANEPKDDWEKEAIGVCARQLQVSAGCYVFTVGDIARVISSAHAAGAREAEEKLGRAMVVVETCVGWQNLNDDCLLCWPNKSGEKGMTHSEHCPLAIQGFINRDASRVVGKETK